MQRHVFPNIFGSNKNWGLVLYISLHRPWINMSLFYNYVTLSPAITRLQTHISAMYICECMWLWMWISHKYILHFALLMWLSSWSKFSLELFRCLLVRCNLPINADTLSVFPIVAGAAGSRSEQSQSVSWPHLQNPASPSISVVRGICFELFNNLLVTRVSEGTPRSFTCSNQSARCACSIYQHTP